MGKEAGASPASLWPRGGYPAGLRCAAYGAGLPASLLQHNGQSYPTLPVVSMPRHSAGAGVPVKPCQH